MPLIGILKVKIASHSRFDPFHLGASVVDVGLLRLGERVFVDDIGHAKDVLCRHEPKGPDTGPRRLRQKHHPTHQRSTASCWTETFFRAKSVWMPSDKAKSRAFSVGLMRILYSSFPRWACRAGWTAPRWRPDQTRSATLLLGIPTLLVFPDRPNAIPQPILADANRLLTPT